MRLISICLCALTLTSFSCSKKSRKVSLITWPRWLVSTSSSGFSMPVLWNCIDNPVPLSHTFALSATRPLAILFGAWALVPSRTYTAGAAYPWQTEAFKCYPFVCEGSGLVLLFPPSPSLPLLQHLNAVCQGRRGSFRKIFYFLLSFEGYFFVQMVEHEWNERYFFLVLSTLL